MRSVKNEVTGKYGVEFQGVIVDLNLSKVRTYHNSVGIERKYVLGIVEFNGTHGEVITALCGIAYGLVIPQFDETGNVIKPAPVKVGFKGIFRAEKDDKDKVNITPKLNGWYSKSSIDGIDENWNFKIGKASLDSKRKWAVGYSGTIRVFFDNIILSYLNVDFTKKSIKLSKSDFCVVKAKSGFFIRYRLDDLTKNNLETVKKALSKGIVFSNLKKIVEQTNLQLRYESNLHGNFIEIKYPLKYANSNDHAIKIYLGSSIKKATNESNIEKLNETYGARLIARAFTNTVTYYRLYLQKEKKAILGVV